MEETEEGLALAKATREIIKRKHDEVVREDEKTKKAKILPEPPRAPCTHEYALPEGYDVHTKQLDEATHGTLEKPVYKGQPAKTYPFVLDTFQEISVACLERRESVMVAAHTSAGKTVVAEYAIAMAFRDKQRVIYTSPLKALSNQKYRELAEEFGDVGLMTGDVTLNPNANCIVMTTEILRSMIYRGSELLREMAWVIFDEVHYMQDRERGVVWEETIIFMPDEARMVFLSATLSNAREFSQWVAHLHKQPCHVVYTEFRPTPLEHYVVPMGGGTLYKVKDDKGFKLKNFESMKEEREQIKKDAKDKKEALMGIGGRGGRGRGRGGRGSGRGGGKEQANADVGQTIINVVRYLKRESMQPIIVFSFSKRECENYAMMCAAPEKGNLCFTTQEEQDAIQLVYDNAMQCLNKEDREIPALQYMLRLLKTGIGVHHGGLLPLLKELIELLFQEQLIKILFTTETFAMGLNMPARTVIFTTLQKWDGSAKRFIQSGEYIQMSGRAGRRGKDTHGTCIILAEDELDAKACEEITFGKPSPLKSSFKLSYYTLLNLMRRVEGGTEGLEYVISNSFQQFQQNQRRPQLEAELRQVQEESSKLQIEGQEALGEYRSLRNQLLEQQLQLQQVLLQPDRVASFLRPGRLVHIVEGDTDWGWGPVVSTPIRTPATAKRGPPPPQPAAAAANGQQQEKEGQDEQQQRQQQQEAAKEEAAAIVENPAELYVVDVLLPCLSGSLETGNPQPGKLGDPGSSLVVLPVALPLVAEISSIRVALPQDLRPHDARASVSIAVADMLDKYQGDPPRLDPVEDMNMGDDPKLQQVVRTIEQLEEKLHKNPVFLCEKDDERFAAFAHKAALDERAQELQAELNDTLLGNFHKECKARVAVMQKLGFLGEDGTVLLKGRAAGEVDTTDELLATELMFNGTFARLDKHQLVALVSCLVQVESSKEEPGLQKKLAEPLRIMQDTARYICDASNACDLPVDEEAYLLRFKPVLMDVIYNWSLGKSFAEVAQMTDLFEGSVIRATRRLDELMMQLAKAAAVVGDSGLKERLEESNATIKRDIMFAASLYL